MVVKPGSDSASPLSEGERPTLKTIAFMTGLAVTTVSRALKDGPEIGEETRKRVQLVANQIGYRPNRAGVRLRTGKTNVISLILNTHEQATDLLSAMIYGISEVIATTPYHLVVTPYSLEGDPLQPVRYVLETGSADGIIISRTEPDDPRVRYLAERNFPFATHGRTLMGIEHAWHDFDNEAYAARAVEELIKRGRRKLALAPPPPKLTYYRFTVDGFTHAVREAGVQGEVLMDVDIDLPMDQLFQQGLEIARRADRPDGLVTSATSSAIAMIAGMEAGGLKLGRDIDVVTKQSSTALKWYRPELITIEEDFRIAGVELARAVIRMIDGADTEDLQTLAPVGQILRAKE